MEEDLKNQKPIIDYHASQVKEYMVHMLYLSPMNHQMSIVYSNDVYEDMLLKS